jgi:hypothetical protein
MPPSNAQPNAFAGRIFGGYSRAPFLIGYSRSISGWLLASGYKFIRFQTPAREQNAQSKKY